MAGVALSGYKNSSSTSIGADKLQDQMNELKIRDDKVKMRGLLASSLLSFFPDYMKMGDAVVKFDLNCKCRKLKQPLLMGKAQKLGT